MVHKNYLNAEQFERYKQFIYAGSIGEAKKMLLEIILILYLIFDYPHKHYTFKHFEV